MLTSSHVAKNCVLAAISPADYPTLFEKFELVDLQFQQIIYCPGQTIDYVYFPLSSVISLVSVGVDQPMSEIVLVGREGLIGLPVFLGSLQKNHQAIVLVSGVTIRVEKNIFLAESERPGIFRDKLLAYTQVRLNFLAQNITCKSHYTIQQQLAGWLLSVYERVEGAELMLTQPFIAQLFGIRRASVTDAAIKLQNAGLIAYRRGKISILDPQGLADFACSRYDTVKKVC